jgi:hypothetical protein
MKNPLLRKKYSLERAILDCMQSKDGAPQMDAERSRHEELREQWKRTGFATDTANFSTSSGAVRPTFRHQ